jgi:DNA-binding NarL/FixJ family response regulator
MTTAPRKHAHPESDKTRVLLVDDHRAMAEGLRAILSRRLDLEVIGHASDGEEAVVLALRDPPDVVLLDLDLPRAGGLEVLKELGAHACPARVLIFSMYANPTFVLQAIALGASGYALKEEPAAQLVEAIREVARGGGYFSMPIRGIAVALGKARDDSIAESRRLTEREAEVVLLVSEGLCLKDAAAKLGLARPTVKMTWTRALRKLGLRAIEKGLYTASLRGR